MPHHTVSILNVDLSNSPSRRLDKSRVSGCYEKRFQQRTLKRNKQVAKLHNPHPGEIIRHEFLDEIQMSQNQLADNIGVPRNRIHAIVNGTRGITADTDLRLCKYFGLSEGYFLRLQNMHDTMEAKRTIADQIEHIRPYSPQTSDNNAKKGR